MHLQSNHASVWAVAGDGWRVLAQEHSEVDNDDANNAHNIICSPDADTYPTPNSVNAFKLFLYMPMSLSAFFHRHLI